jgi:hypothetical protein
LTHFSLHNKYTKERGKEEKYYKIAPCIYCVRKSVSK